MECRKSVLSGEHIVFVALGLASKRENYCAPKISSDTHQENVWGRMYYRVNGTPILLALDDYDSATPAEKDAAADKALYKLMSRVDGATLQSHSGTIVNGFIESR